MASILILKGVCLLLIGVQIILHNNGIRRIVIFDLHQGIVFGLMHLLIYIPLLGTGAYYINLITAPKSLILAGYAIVPAWYLITGFVSLQAVRQSQLGFFEFLKDMSFFLYENPPLQAVMRSLLRLVLGLIGIGLLVLYNLA